MAGPSGNESNHRIDGLTIAGGLAFEGVGGQVTYINEDVVGDLARAAVMKRAQGYYAETLPRSCQTGSTLMTTQTVSFTPIGLAQGDIVTNILSSCTTLGSGFSGINMKLGLYSSSLALLASTGDVSAAFGSTGDKTSPLTAPYTVLGDGGFWIASLAIATTPPTLSRGLTSVFTGAFTGAAMGNAGRQTGQTDLPATAVVTYSASAVAYWHGVN